jgi:hypothetical protein
MIISMMMLQQQVIILFLLLFNYSSGRCPFQNPFWFIDRPTADSVYDENGDMVANKIRVMWGKLENFKCIDYFQIEYFKRTSDEANNQILDITDKIDRSQRHHDIEVIPCTEYYFKVVAAEDWNGIREDFKVYSDTVRFTVKYTPRFNVLPRFREKRRMNFLPDPPPSLQNEMNLQNEILEQKEEIFYNIRWRLKDVDYPLCLHHFELHFLDLMDPFNSTKFIRRVLKPFKRPKFLLQIQSVELGEECEFDVQFIFKMFGIHRQSSLTYWTPPPCVFTTTTLPPPTSSTSNYTDWNGTDLFSIENSNSSNYNISSMDYELNEIDDDEAFIEFNTNAKNQSTKVDSLTSLEVVDTIISTTRSYAEEMKATRAQISSLKKDYERIGWQDFSTLKDSFFESMKDFLTQMKAEDVEEDRVLFEDGKNQSYLKCLL